MIRLYSALALLLTLAAQGCRQEAGQFRPPRAGDPAPPYAAPLLTGDTVRLTDLRGTVVMLNIWATWCPPCREEMPGLQQLHGEYGARGLRVVATSIDQRGAESAIREFVREHRLTFTILHDVAEDVSRQFRTAGVPETYLIGPDGVIAHRWIGKFDPMAADVRQLVEGLLPARH
jgi:peroxiredoxin